MKTKNMKSAKINVKRLQKWAIHLINGPIKSKIVPVNQEIETFGCEEGHGMWLPILTFPLFELIELFPGEWKFNTEKHFVCVADEDKDIVSSISQYFGINTEMFFHLLCPDMQTCCAFGGQKLKHDAQPIDVAVNIWALIIMVKSCEDNHFQICLN